MAVEEISASRGSDIAEFFAEDAVQIELPSKLNPRGGSSDLAALSARIETGRSL